MDMKSEYDFSKGKRGAIDPLPAGKERITIRLDADILAWFRQQVDLRGGGNYQTLINQALREYVAGQQLPIEDLLRRVLREELPPYESFALPEELFSRREIIMPKDKKTVTRYRDAVTGQYTTKNKAQRNPKTTVKETDKIAPKKKSKKKK